MKTKKEIILRGNKIMTDIDKKLKDLRGLLDKVDEVRKEVESRFPPKHYLVIWENIPTGAPDRIWREYSLKEARQRVNFIQADGRKYHLTIAEIVSEN